MSTNSASSDWTSCWTVSLAVPPSRNKTGEPLSTANFPHVRRMAARAAKWSTAEVTKTRRSIAEPLSETHASGLSIESCSVIDKSRSSKTSLGLIVDGIGDAVGVEFGTRDVGGAPEVEFKLNLPLIESKST